MGIKIGVKPLKNKGINRKRFVKDLNLKFLTRFFVSISVIICFIIFGFQPVYAVTHSDIVRVGITDNQFQNVLRQEVTLYGTAECELCDKATKTVITRVSPDTDIIIRNCPKGLITEINNRAYTLQDLVLVCPKGILGIRGLTRKGKQALYHGAFEIVQSDNKEGFYVVNLVEIQDYLKGVVPNEMPVSFGLEALKAQAVAARNYVLTPRTQSYKEFNVVDSVASQVYFGVNTEDDLATRAVMETDGVVALYNNELILALYSSTAGGYTESYANAFSDPNTKIFPAPTKPYMSAVPDKSDFEPLDSDAKAKEFYETRIPSFDIESPYYRWSKEWGVNELEETLRTTLPIQSKTGFVFPAVREKEDIGNIKDIKVMKRGNSGKIMEVEILTSKGCYTVSKELVIRRVFQKDGVSLPSANAVFEKKLDTYGNVKSIVVYGGGFGHGVGMSQFGAGYMASKLKQPYYNILRHYYTDINLGTIPVTVSGEDVKQTFWAPIGRAQIIVTDTTSPKIAVMINGKELEFPISAPIFHRVHKVDISRYIDDGFNSITFHAPSLGRSVKLYIELVEKYGHHEYKFEGTSEDDEE